MGHGSQVANIVQPRSEIVFSAAAAWRIAFTSACAVGSHDSQTVLCAIATTSSPRTIAAPNGDCPAAIPPLALSMASCMNWFIGALYFGLYTLCLVALSVSMYSGTWFASSGRAEDALKDTRSMPMLNTYFELEARGTTAKRELRGAITTFLTMAYILFANPDILGAAGVPKDSATACTAAAAGICCILMGLLANFPIAMASGMGLNAFVAFQIAKQPGWNWQMAMALIVV